MTALTVGSLFSGIGGIDLGLERAGMTVIWQSEIDQYASKVLAKHWPTVPNLGDITTIDWSTVERPDLICGGYPCQPFSLAGTRAGADDPRHLWPHFHGAIRHLRPRYALLENVPGHLSMGFDTVLGNLAEIGYDTEWCSIPAAAVGAPHLRWRIFCVATDTHADVGGREVIEERDGDPACDPADGHSRRNHADGLRDDVPDTERDDLRQQPESIFGRSSAAVARDDGTPRVVADTQGVDGKWAEPTRDSGRRPEGPIGDSRNSPLLADPDIVARPSTFPLGVLADATTRRSIHRTDGCGGPIGRHWAVEPDVGRVAHGVPSRVDRLRCLGNAVVPQVAEWIGRRIMEAAA